MLDVSSGKMYDLSPTLLQISNRGTNGALVQVVRIDQIMKKGEFPTVKNIKESFTHAIAGNGRLHLLGLISDGGVHSHQNHLYALLATAKEMKVPEVYIHFFGDGRDTDPKSSVGYMQELLDKIKEMGMEKTAKLATAVGRYYAMDRDKRYVPTCFGASGGD